MSEMHVRCLPRCLPRDFAGRDNCAAQPQAVSFHWPLELVAGLRQFFQLERRVE